MAAFEIIEEPLTAPTGTFTPQADQKQFVSAFACVGGARQPGWEDGHSIRNGIPTQDGRGRLKFDEFKSATTKNPNVVKYNGMELREFIAPRADAVAKERHDAKISSDKCAAYLKPTSTPSNEQQVGRVSGGGIQMVEQTAPAPTL